MGVISDCHNIRFLPYLGWEVRLWKEDVKGGEPPHEVALLLLEAVALVHDGLHGAAVQGGPTDFYSGN